MIEFKVDTEGNKVTGTFEVQGDHETVTTEIYMILVELSKRAPEAFEDAVAMHELELMEKLEKKGAKG